MSNDQPPPLTEDEQKFVQFVIMQAQQILYVLGTPTPEGEDAPPNLEAAKMLIDQMEMLQVKTKGNLTEQETHIFKEALSRVQMAFVQASGGTPASMMPERSTPEMPEDPGLGAAPPEPEAKPPEPTPAPSPDPAPTTSPAPPAEATAPEPPATTEKKDPEPEEPEENKKRFVKKYG